MKIKLGQLNPIIEGLNQLMVEKLPIKVAYSISKVAKKIQEEAKTYEENRKVLLERYCDRDKEDKPIIENDHYVITDKAFATELNELNEVTIDIEFKTISLNSLEGLVISPMTMYVLEMFIEEVE